MDRETISLETYDLKAVKHEIHIFQKKLADLRKDGSTKLLSLEEEIGILKDDKQVPSEEKKEKIAAYKEEITKAKAVKAGYKEEEKQIVGEAKKYLKENFDTYYYAKKKEAVELKKAEMAKYAEELNALKAEFDEKLLKEKEPLEDETKDQTAARVAILKRTKAARLYELKLNHLTQKWSLYCYDFILHCLWNNF